MNSAVMFVGGPNTRTDFHIDQSSEFFWMLKGNMELPIIERGKKRVVSIREGEVFLLPPRIPHSPQRPEKGSLGLVIERERNRDANELDGLRWYTDFRTCDKVLWERYFYCGDLGRDLVPVVTAFKSSEEAQTGLPTDENVYENPPVEQDRVTTIPAPFALDTWLAKNKEVLAGGNELKLFGHDHPDSQIRVTVGGGEAMHKVTATTGGVETLVVQLEGECSIAFDDGKKEVVGKGCCAVVKGGVAFAIERPKGTIGMVIRHFPPEFR